MPPTPAILGNEKKVAPCLNIYEYYVLLGNDYKISGHEVKVCKN